MITAACTPSSPTSPTSIAAAIQEVNQREILFPSYPVADRTYLSLSPGHGFQVNYIAPNGRAWLWYPGNRISLPELYKLDVVAGQQALCWQHPSNSYNPVTKQGGGKFACQSLELSRKTVVAELRGDPFELSSGAVPYPLERCTAPDAFQFDRTRFAC